MSDKSVKRVLVLVALTCAAAFTTSAFAATAAPAKQGMTLWELVLAGGFFIIVLALLSVALVALTIYHFMYIKPEKLIPQDMTENLLSLIERKEYEKAKSVCRQQENLVSAIALKGLEKQPKGPTVVEEALQYEGRIRVESLWQNLTYLGDIAVIAPMVGLIGTIMGMIDSFNSFQAATLNPTVLTQGLAKAMINTAVGLVIAVPALVFYSYFRGRISRVTSQAEAVTAELAQMMGESR